jgi:hypothetical protein
MTISNLSSAAFATSLLMVVTMYMHDARLEYVSESNSKPRQTIKAAAEEASIEDITMLSTGRHIHIENMTLPSNMTNTGTSLASSTPRTRDNEDKVAVNKLVTNTYGNNSDK